MIKTIFLLVFIVLLTKNTFAQRYFKIEGTGKIFTLYNKRASSQINDSNITNEKDKIKVTSIARGSNEIERTRFIEVGILRVEEVSADSKFIEGLLKKNK